MAEVADTAHEVITRLDGSESLEEITFDLLDFSAKEVGVGLAKMLGGSVAAAVADGVTDDTEALQAAFDACPEGGTVVLPVGQMVVSQALVIDHQISVVGSGVGVVGGSALQMDNGSGPTISPFLVGSVIVQTGAGENGIEIVADAACVNLADFGVRFHEDILGTDTGHGIYAASPTVVGDGHELGLYGSFWRNVRVFGHDGDHYGFYLVNSILTSMSHLCSYGGGGFFFEGEMDGTVTGNALLIHPYSWLFCGGSANNYTFKSTRDGINLLSVMRPQAILNDVPAVLSGLGIPSPDDTQYMWKHEGAVERMSIYDPDLEGPVFDNPVDFGGLGDNVIVRPGGILLGPDLTAAESQYATRILAIDVDTNLTVVAGAGAGVASGGVASTPFGGRDHGCRIRIASGSAPGGAGSLICSVTYGRAGFRDAIILQATDTTPAAELGLFPFGFTETGFDVYAREAMAPSTTYDFYFLAQKAYE